MKVLVLIRQHSFAKAVMADLAEACQRLGWKVEWLDLDAFIRERRELPREDKYRAVDELLRRLERWNPGMVFSYGLEYQSALWQELLPEVKTRFYDQLPRPAVYFFFDFGYPFDREPDDETEALLARMEGPEHIVFCWDRMATAEMAGRGLAKIFHFPMAVNERVFHRKLDAARTENVVFIGGPTPERRETLAAIADLGLKVYGYDAAGWETSGSLRAVYRGAVLDRDQACDIYNAARISVNVTRPHGPASLNMRVFEAMACGSLMVTDDRADARKYFVDDREIVIYKDAADLRAKVLHFLAEPDEAVAIAEAGRRRVLDSHTYQKRLEERASVIERFCAECSRFQQVEGLFESDPSKARDLLDLFQVREELVYNQDNYHYCRARLSASLGQPVEARVDLSRALAANSRHRGALRLAREWQGS